MNIHRPTRIVTVVTAAAALALGSASVATAAPDPAESALAAARTATAAYHDVNNLPDSYQPFLDCMQSDQGGMGLHYVDFSAVGNADENVTHPEALVYAETPEGLQLVAVEYIVPASLVPDPTHPPVVLGQTLTEEDVPGAGDLYVLHAWIWRANPAGMFQDWNPALDSCPES